MVAFLKTYFFAEFKPRSGEFSSLHGLRTIALFMLFYVHGYFNLAVSMEEHSIYLRNFLINGSASIDLFFMLSGFLISGQLFHELKKTDTISFKRFFTRRTLRIFPPYYIFILYQHFVLVPKIVKQAGNMASSTEIAAYRNQWIFDMLYITNYFPDRFMIHNWSLSVEEQFYIFLPPFLLYAYKKIKPDKRIFLLLSVVVIPLVFRFISLYTLVLPSGHQREAYDRFIYWPFFTHADSIFIGVVAAHIWAYNRNIIDTLNSKTNLRRVIIVVLSLVLVLYSSLVYEYEPGILSQVIRFPVFSLSFTMIMFLSFKETGWLNKVLSFKFLIPFARLSYSTYIIHLLIMLPLTPLIMKKWGPKIDLVEFTFAWLIFTFTSVFFGYLFYLIAERPFLLLREYLPRRWFS